MTDDDPVIRAYNLETDPEELRPLALDRDDPLVQAVLAIKAPTPGQQAQLDTEQLKALGYMH